ncbi:phosphoglycerate dehydrogenase [Pullulanibacillus sp. KACC 23026]|uniref:phosphoglycerate dehydrogenase n=1 Tax=Pullulanibacillus sp. KACC 23026 TaxID=3028315 RepID=UPI0023B06B97|nr:phosphoglycerate dehydrogenase [Pullulanibacillus sp. KACC 23026]WEG13363.1 phosphoglycerate dehydrogenase [Pullulanibacillus sp. KACC 23026]
MVGKILITPKSYKNYKEDAHRLLKQQGYEIIENNLGRTMTETEIIEAAKEDVVGIIVGVDPLPSQVLSECKALRAISKYGVGMDNIDLKKAEELGIKVQNAVGTNAVSVAEHAIGLMFACSRHLFELVRDVKDFSWNRKIGFELTEKKLGVIGGGQIGREVAKRSVGIGMNVTIYDPYFKDGGFLEEYGIEKQDDLSLVLETSDLVTLHLPANEETKGLINKETLKLMKSTAVLINTSRGELVVESDLYEALVNEEIAFAAQDVYSSEPPKQGDPLIGLPNFLLTPHSGAYTHEAVKRMVMISTQNLVNLLNMKI